MSATPKRKILFLLLGLTLTVIPLIVNTFLYHRFAYYSLTHKWMIFVSILGLLIVCALIIFPLEKYLRIGRQPLRPKIRSFIMSALLLTLTLLATRGIQLSGIYLNKKMIEKKLKRNTITVPANINVHTLTSGIRRKRTRKVVVAYYQVNHTLYQGIVDSSAASKKQIEVVCSSEDPHFFLYKKH